MRPTRRLGQEPDPTQHWVAREISDGCETRSSCISENDRPGELIFREYRARLARSAWADGPVSIYQKWASGGLQSEWSAAPPDRTHDSTDFPRRPARRGPDRVRVPSRPPQSPVVEDQAVNRDGPGTRRGPEGDRPSAPAEAGQAGRCRWTGPAAQGTEDNTGEAERDAGLRRPDAGARLFGRRDRGRRQTRGPHHHAPPGRRAGARRARHALFAGHPCRPFRLPPPPARAHPP